MPIFGGHCSPATRFDQTNIVGAMHAPFTLGDQRELLRLFTDARTSNVEVQTQPGIVSAHPLQLDRELGSVGVPKVVEEEPKPLFKGLDDLTMDEWFQEEERVERRVRV